jgi:hypothetical protein
MTGKGMGTDSKKDAPFWVRNYDVPPDEAPPIKMEVRRGQQQQQQVVVQRVQTQEQQLVQKSYLPYSLFFGARANVSAARLQQWSQLLGCNGIGCSAGNLTCNSCTADFSGDGSGNSSSCCQC